MFGSTTRILDLQITALYPWSTRLLLRQFNEIMQLSGKTSRGIASSAALDKERSKSLITSPFRYFKRLIDNPLRPSFLNIIKSFIFFFSNQMLSTHSLLRDSTVKSFSSILIAPSSAKQRTPRSFDYESRSQKYKTDHHEQKAKRQRRSYGGTTQHGQRP